MGLILPPFRFCSASSNLPMGSGTGTPSNTGTSGTNFTAGNTNADGTSVSVISSLAHDVHYLTIQLAGATFAAADDNVLVDILTDPAGGTSWGSFIDDLVAGGTPTPAATSSYSLNYHFPIWIKSGTAIGVRARTAHTSDLTLGRIIINAFGDPSRPDMWWCGQKVESLGINASSSKGTNVTPGNSGSWGSWTTIGTSTYAYGAVQFQTNSIDSNMNGEAYYLQVGIGSNQLPGSPTGYFLSTTGEQITRNNMNQIIWCDVPASTAWQLRATCSNTAETLNCAVYGVY